MNNAYILPSEAIKERDGWKYALTVMLRDKRGRISYWDIYDWRGGEQ